MTELELLQQLAVLLGQLHEDFTYILFSFGVIAGLLLVILFAMAWGRNT